MSILRKHLLGLHGMSEAQIYALLDLAATDAQIPRDALRGRTVVNVFYEPSTRTRISFELAARRLGAAVVNFDVATSAVQKGECLVDTVRTLEAMGADAIVIRHPHSGAPHLAARHVRCAVVNAGDGMHEHPTQALLDLLTIREAKGGVGGLRVAIVGDVAHSRVARSATYGLTTLGASVVLCGPSTLVPPNLAGPGVEVTHRLEDALCEADVVMPLRMQMERAAGGYVPSLSEYHRLYAITPQRLRLARPDAVVMHPGPMNLGVEIVPEVAYGDRSVVLRQVRHGIGVRMAVLYDLLAARADLVQTAPIARRAVGAGRAPAGTRS
ncbi:MAG: aspartate carbamoyltransferase catalytic subunit [Armatimonadota bacterium]|nr:aspartate carbamoyltransferase catalytic subunit [Armatimonadota bacterium]MDR5697827.1 aspartate carbamoyltransferase catalytic subunit [Armatimonadota bacterium]